MFGNILRTIRDNCASFGDTIKINYCKGVDSFDAAILAITSDTGGLPQSRSNTAYIGI